MKLTKLHRVLISLPLAIFAALILVSISELTYNRTRESLNNLTYYNDTHTQVSTLIQQMLNAETGLRGYLLTGDENYLSPYTNSIAGIHHSLEEIRKQLQADPQSLEVFAPLERSITRKTTEMDLSLKLFKEGNADALKFVMFTDVGNKDMINIRELSDTLKKLSLEQVKTFHEDINSSIFLARMGVASATLIGMIAFYLYLRQTNMIERMHKREQALQSEERSRLEELVKERTSTLAELATHLQQVREEERAHLARELHDELGSLLTAAKLDVARLKSRIDMDNPEVAERIKHLADTLNSGIALKRRIIEDLRPSSLSNLGLSTSLEILTSEFSQRSGIQIEPSFEAVKISDAIELTIYRLVQESLTNISKYAKASVVKVSLHSYSSYIAVQIHDNGQGFDTSNVKPSSHGLSGMRHRVEAAGGKLTITSEIGKGTTISAVIPVEEGNLQTSNQ